MDKHIELLKKVNNFAYAPYSGFKVSSVLVTKSGKVFTGVNVENLSFGATICAERTAILEAVKNGEKDFEKIYIYTTNNNGEHNLTPPCGLCRQVMAEFSKDLEIIMVSSDKIVKSNISELLPCKFENKL